MRQSLKHPVVEIVCRLFTHDTKLGWTLDEESEAFIIRLLQHQRSSPTIVEAVEGLIQVAASLVQEHGADKTAGKLFVVLADFLKDLDTEQARRLERARRKASKLLGGVSPIQSRVPPSKRPNKGKSALDLRADAARKTHDG